MITEQQGVVLVVDDEPAIRRLLSRSLSSAGFAVHEAEDGNRALDLLRREPVDIAIVDLNMPGMDGVTTLRMMRDYSPRLQVLVMTGLPTVDTAVESMKAEKGPAAARARARGRRD